MKLRNLMTVGLIATGLTMTAQAENRYRNDDVDHHERAEQLRRLERERRQEHRLREVREHERHDRY